MVRASLLIVLAVGALTLGACGGDEETTVTETVTTTETATAPATTGEATTAPSGTSTGGGGSAPGPGPGGGETADLPLCSQGPPPCRNPDGSVVEP